MKCEECLSALEHGKFWRRCTAQRHAAGCPACAQAIAALAAWKQTLAAHDPLPPHQRERWLSAADVQTASRREHRTATYLAIGTAAAALVAVAAWLLRGPAQQPPIAFKSRSVPGSQAVQLEIHGDPAVRQGLAQLADELDKLSKAAALLDERRQVRELMDETH